MCKLKGRYYQLYPSLSTHCHRSFLLNVLRFILTIIRPYFRSTIPTVRRFLVFVVTKTENDHKRLQTTRNHQKPPRNDHTPPANHHKPLQTTTNHQETTTNHQQMTKNHQETSTIKMKPNKIFPNANYLVFS